MHQPLDDVLDLEQHPLHDEHFRDECKRALDENGVLTIRNFLKSVAIASIQHEAEENQHLAYYTANKHNIYLTMSDPAYTADHPRNREVISSKGCITTDQIPTNSALSTLYDAPGFRAFLCAVLGEKALYEYADPLSSMNIHYASEGQELGWHFDNSSFAITLMIQKPESGGTFEYVDNVRDADNGDMNYALSEQILNGEILTKTLSMDAGTLVLFRGRNSIHRVTPIIGNRPRILAVLAYNTKPDISLSESARMTFFGRLQ
ncbi:MAG: 2OG-Fe(II) oxygenase [Pseudomonadota bacterium]